MNVTDRIRPVPPGVKTLRNSDCMSADDFHRIYKEMPEDFKAELIGGVVYVASPFGLDHAVGHSDLNGLFWIYSGATPGVQCGDAATIRLGPTGEPQPDLFLRILPECGGQSRRERKAGAAGSPSIYVGRGYDPLVLTLPEVEQRLTGFSFHSGSFAEMTLDLERAFIGQSDGVLNVGE